MKLKISITLKKQEKQKLFDSLEKLQQEKQFLEQQKDEQQRVTEQKRRADGAAKVFVEEEKYLGAARDEIRATVAHKINDVFCSANKA